MSISDSSGTLSTRNTDSARSDVTRPDVDGARPLIGKTQTPGQEDKAGDERPCALIVSWEEWHTAEDEKVCPECAPLDGAWYQQGFGPQPPLHDHCRCYRIWVWDECQQSDPGNSFGAERPR